MRAPSGAPFQLRLCSTMNGPAREAGPWPIPTPVALNIVRVLRRRFEARIPKPHEPMMVPQR
jgi:hypothetical protein